MIYVKLKKEEKGRIKKRGVKVPLSKQVRITLF